MFSDPLKNLKAIPVHEHHIVVDLGAGTGYYSVAAGKLASLGKVYAVDIAKDYLHTIQNKAKEAHLQNVEIIWGDVEKKNGTKLKDGLADVVIASNILFQVEDKKSFIEEIKRILKPKGKVLLVDWNSDSPLMGGRHVVGKSKAEAMFIDMVLKLQRENNTGEHHYGTILRVEK